MIASLIPVSMSKAVTAKTDVSYGGKNTLCRYTINSELIKKRKGGKSNEEIFMQHYSHTNATIHQFKAQSCD